MSSLGLLMSLRSTLAGWLFLLAGKLDEKYDVWLDEVEHLLSMQNALDAYWRGETDEVPRG